MPTTHPGKQRSRRRLLLVEDDRASHIALKGILVRLGWEVEVATTVQDGLALLGSNFESIILDLMLPDGDGATILKRVRVDGMRMKVAVTSGVSDSDWLEQVAALQPDGFFKKPIDLPQLLNVIGA